MRPSLCTKLGVGLITAALVSSAAPAWAQGGGGGGGGGGGSGGGSGGSGSGGLGGTSARGNTEMGITSQNASLAGGFTTGTMSARSNSVSSANFLQQYFINPMSQGIVQGTQQTPTLSFGTPIFNMTTSGSGSSGFGGAGGGGRTGGGSSFGGSSAGSFGGTSSLGGGGGRTGGGGGSSGGAFGSSFGGGSQGFGGVSGSSFGTSSGFGGVGGVGGIGGSRTGATGLGGTAGARSGSASGIMTYTSTNFGPTNGVRAPNYVTTLQFPAPILMNAGFTPVAINAELPQVIARSTGFSVPGAVTVANDGSTTVLRGRVANDDERRLAENMLRLGGVREIRNELQVPATPAGNQ